MSAETYSQTPRSTVNRYKTRALYDHDTVHEIIDTTPVAHVSFNPTSWDEDPFPTILPMLACTGAFTEPGASEQSATAIYLHGHAASRFMRLPEKQKEDDTGLPGVPVCVAATHFDGVVLALTPFNHSCNYRSAVVHGFAVLVTSPAEKMYALQRLTDNLVPERWDNSRVPPTTAEMTATSVLRVDIVSASAKVRAYAPGNDRADLDAPAVLAHVWTGVVPASIQYGTPVPANENQVAAVPKYLGDWVSSTNVTSEGYARNVAGLSGTAKK